MKLTVLARLLTSIVAPLLASVAFAQAVIVAQYAPPAPRVEVVPAPRAGYVWDGGHWYWELGRYVWVPGRWQEVRVGHRWVLGHWAQFGLNWHWVPGHWV
ncbi:YXWGXW repeat-containing protein [Paraburkholderia sediminicola]|uniref:YXWGXW repeat-containing protein n=1 Tax=Paraburkholderia sediminicola TaxID=458836 RepID=UPI0038B8FD61